MYYNIRSLLSKVDELRSVSDATKPDIICIVETWLNNNIPDNEPILSNYQLFRLDRNRHGGGIAIYVCTVLLCSILLQGGPHGLEFLSGEADQLLDISSPQTSPTPPTSLTPPTSPTSPTSPTPPTLSSNRDHQTEKVDELRSVSDATKPDIICIVETWLDNNILDNEPILSNYQLFRLDRNRHGGGIAIYVCTVLLCSILLQGGPHGLEFLSRSIVLQPLFTKFCLSFLSSTIIFSFYF